MLLTLYTHEEMDLGLISRRGFPVALVVKSVPAKARNVRNMGLIPGSRRSPGEGHDNPFQYSCLENPMDKRTWWATVHRVVKSSTD